MVFFFRLAENARKTPQPQSTLLKFSNEANTEELNDRNNYLIDLDDVSTQDIGPFFGLPTTVKNLLKKLRGISSLYGKLYYQILTLVFCLTKDYLFRYKYSIYYSILFLKVLFMYNYVI